jgi:alkaline phosphatase
MSLTSRRAFLKSAVSGAAVAALPAALPASTGSAPSARRKGGEIGGARNLIFLVSDGMSLGTLSMAQQFRRRREGRGTEWIGLYGREGVHRALVDTASASSIVTDSAAASSAWGGGMRVANGAINVGPRGELPQPLLDAARASGRATGLVSTATITHATPAGFAVNVPGRNDEDTIAERYLRSDVDLFLGGGSRFLDPARRADGKDLFAAFAEAGYAIARDRAALAAAPTAGRLLGVFSSGHMPFSLDRAASAELSAAVPTLAEMAEVALARLSAKGGDRGFVLQIEGARVDHAAHANDFGGLVHDQLAFDDALAVALRFAAGRDDTLVIVTTDHGNSNPGLNGTGGAYRDTDAAFERSFTLRQTNDWIIDGLSAQSDAAAVQDRIVLGTGLNVSKAEAALVHRALRKDYADAYRARSTPVVVLGQVLANHLAVGWTGVSHTSDMAELVAMGPGSEVFSGLLLNVQVHGLVRQALELPRASV